MDDAVVYRVYFHVGKNRLLTRAPSRRPSSAPSNADLIAARIRPASRKGPAMGHPQHTRRARGRAVTRDVVMAVGNTTPSRCRVWRASR